MVNNQKDLKMNINNQDNDYPSLEEIEYLLHQILPEETVSEIMKALSMSSFSAYS